MDHFQPYRQQLDTALCLEATEKQPHGVSLAVSQHNTADLRQRCVYYRDHLDQFKQETLKQLMRDTLAVVDLSVLCSSCLARFQSECGKAFTSQLQQGHQITYSVRRKKRSQ